MTKKLIDYFPKGFTPRQAQVDVINHIEQCVDNGIRFIVLECPPGFGKSHIASTICNYSNDCPDRLRELVDSNDIFTTSEDEKRANEEELIGMDRWGASCLTVTKNLQNQYDSLFKDTTALKGMNNYDCNLDDTFTADIAPCTTNWSIANTCRSNNACDFYNTTKQAMKSKFAVYNYSKYLTLPKFMRSKQFLICDEASEIEDAIVNFFTTTINYKLLDKYNIDYGSVKVKSDDMSTNIDWLCNVRDGLKKQIETLKSSIKSTSYSETEKKRNMKALQYCKNTLNSVSIVISSNSLCDYVCQYDRESCSFSPLYINALADLLWSNNTHIILMSGTIFDHNTFTRTLGIKKSEYSFLESESVSDPKLNPIYVPAKYSINYKTQDAVLPKIIDQARGIVAEHKDSNGIIHTHTHKITSKFIDRVGNNSDGRYMFRQNNTTNEHLVLQHAMDETPTVIVSPSMAFGVDLPDDLSRFQIIMKLPYMSLGDKRVKELANRDREWYTMKMFVKLIQMCGRSTRSKDDYCDTYILDLGVINVIKREWSNLPRHFRERFEV